MVYLDDRSDGDIYTAIFGYLGPQAAVVIPDGNNGLCDVPSGAFSNSILNSHVTWYGGFSCKEVSYHQDSPQGEWELFYWQFSNRKRLLSDLQNSTHE